MRKLLFVFLIGSTLILASGFDQPLKIKEPVVEINQTDNHKKSESKSFVQQEIESFSSDIRDEEGLSISEMIGEVIMDSIQMAVQNLAEFFKRIFS